MGGGISLSFLQEEQLKPLDASDIPNGDFEAAKQEVQRLRQLISRVDLNMVGDNENIQRKVYDDMKPSMSLVGTEKTSILESAEGQKYWNSLGQPSPRDKPRIERPEYGTEKTSVLESAEGKAYWSNLGQSKSHEKPKAVQTEYGVDKTSPHESAEGDAYWRGEPKVLNDNGHPIVPNLSQRECDETIHMNTLLREVREQIFTKTKTMEEAFLKMDQDQTGYISREEFCGCLSKMGYFITDDEFDLINKTYPHHHGKDQDKGISYLEFVTMLTGKLTYVPGFGEDISLSNDDQIRIQYLKNERKNDQREDRELWHNYLAEKRKAECRLQRLFSKRVFEGYFSMKEAFKDIDKDKSGFIDPDELIEILRTTLQIEASEDDVLDLMEKFDTNHDGKLAYHEFVKLLQLSDFLDPTLSGVLDDI